MYKVCEKCGANLDYEEKCRCEMREREKFKVIPIKNGLNVITEDNKVYEIPKDVVITMMKSNNIWAVDTLCQRLERKISSICEVDGQTVFKLNGTLSGL